MSDRLITAAGLSVETNGFTRLHETDMAVPSGLTVITGPSGSGKSTLLKALCGITKPTTGKVTHWNAEGVSVYRSKAEAAPGIGARVINWLRLDSAQESAAAQYRSVSLGYIPQHPHIPEGLTGYEYIHLPHAARGNNLDPNYVQRLTDRLGISKQLGKQAAQMSGGELQRVTVAFALAHNPNIVFADEPTASLDSSSRKLTMELFRESVDRTGVSVICVSHDDVARDYADTEIKLLDGQITFVGSPASYEEQVSAPPVVATDLGWPGSL